MADLRGLMPYDRAGRTVFLVERAGAGAPGEQLLSVQVAVAPGVNTHLGPQADPRLSPEPASYPDGECERIAQRGVALGPGRWVVAANPMFCHDSAGNDLPVRLRPSSVRTPHRGVLAALGPDPFAAQPAPADPVRQGGAHREQEGPVQILDRLRAAGVIGPAGTEPEAPYDAPMAW